MLRPGRAEGRARAGLSRPGGWRQLPGQPTACSPTPWPRRPPLLDVLAGYEPGDATWAPPPERPFAELRDARPGAAARRTGPEPAAARGRGRSGVRRRRALGARPSWSRWVTQVEEITPPWGEGDLLTEFTRVWAPLISMQTLVGAMLRGREPTPEDVEPLTWVMWENAHASRRAGLRGRRGEDEDAGPVDPHLPGPVRPCGYARRWPAGRCRSVRSTAGAGALGPLPPLGPVHAVHGHVQRDRPAGHLSAAVSGGGRAAPGRPADRTARWARASFWPSRLSSSRRCPGQTGARLRSRKAA